MKQQKTYHRLPQRNMDIALQELLKRFLDDYANGIYRIGQILPSPRLLAKDYGVTFSTARNLYTRLHQKGFVQTIPRKGTVLCCIPEPSALGRKDLVRNGLTTIGVLEYINPNAILNHTMTQLRTIDELCNRNQIPSRFYNLHKQLDQRLKSDPVYITKEDISALNKQHAAGFIVLISRQISNEQNLKQLRKLKAPVILVNTSSAVPGFCTISCDEVKSGHIAASYLQKLKHRKIAFLGYDCPASWQDERILGYREAMKENDLKPIERWSHFFPYGETDNIVRDCRETVWQEAPKIMETCTAAVCASDDLSVLMLQYAYEHHVAPISLVSFDNGWKFRSWELSSVQYPLLEIAMAAFQQIQLMQEKEEREPVWIQVPGILYKRLSAGKFKQDIRSKDHQIPDPGRDSALSL